MGSYAAHKSAISLRDIEDLDEIRSVEDLQIAAWGDDERDIVPLNQLVAAQHVGGSLIGAFDARRLVGFAYGFYGHREGRVLHHSHMLAVDRDYRRHDLGFDLKLAQRQKVLKDGLTDVVTWTFDPLQSLNAHFNFKKLGVIADTYKVDVYGRQGRSFLHQNGTDRLFVTWHLKSPKVMELAARERSSKASDGENLVERYSCLLRMSESGIPENVIGFGSVAAKKRVSFQIPVNINDIEKTDPIIARQWRVETRRIFTRAFSEGFVVVDYLGGHNRFGTYLLEHREDLTVPR